MRYRFDGGALKWERVWEHGCDFERRCLPSPVIHRGRVWVSGDIGMVFDLATGTPSFAAAMADEKSRSVPRIGSLGACPSTVAGGGHILQTTNKGAVRVFAADGQDLKPVHGNHLAADGFTVPAPCIAGDCLDLRTDRALYVIGRR